MKTGVIIARFQSPYLHPGHMELIQKVGEKHHKLVIVLGVCPIIGSRRNPYDFHTREKMIKAAFPNVIVLPLSDHPSDEKWSKKLEIVPSHMPLIKYLINKYVTPKTNSK